MKYDTRTIKLETPLPCGIWAPDGQCGKDAYVAHAYQLEPSKYRGYTWGLLPVCRECTEKTLKIYAE